MKEMTELEVRIVKCAKRMILEKGILDTDMKDIAKEIGCSRSTLYRHFPGKGDILLILADEALEVIRKAQIIPPEYRFSNGLEAFSWQLNSMLDAALQNVDTFTFLRDFDCLYYRYYMNEEQSNEFRENVKESSVKSPLQESYNRGVKDGSIRSGGDGELFVLTVFQSFIALTERILPLEETYIEAYGYGQEILREFTQKMVASIQNKG